MVFALEVAKGIRKVLEERGINTSPLNGDQMRVILANHDDFKNETPKLTRFLESRGQVALFLPKLLWEINPTATCLGTVH